MTMNDILQRLEGVKGRDGSYMARCPAHGDRNASLSVSQGRDGRVLLKCFAGCSPEEITGALNLSMRDLFPDTAPAAPSPARKPDTPEAEYFYRDGQLLKRKFRKADGSKFCTWHHRTASGWAAGRNGLEAGLYTPAEDPGPMVFLVEGEKDADNLCALGIGAVSLPDGAQSKWLAEYNDYFRDRMVMILPDNDPPGKEYADRCAQALQDTAACLWIAELTKLLPDLPEKGDVSDVLERLGPEATRKALAELAENTPLWEPKPDPFLASFKSLNSFRQEEAAWLVPGWIPQGQITLLAADGGVGKTTLWCQLLADLSAGRPCFLDPPGTRRRPMKVAFCTTEDSVPKKLKKTLMDMGAVPENILVMDIAEDRNGLLQDFKFGSQQLSRFIRHFRPELCVFDPVQGFIPPKVNMASRNEMRACMAPLIALGEEVGTSFLVICHTNKRKGSSGRDRIADSADLWDIARSVAMMGYTGEDGTRYLSNEKNNYAPLRNTLLFSLDSHGICPRGYTHKRDRDYNQEHNAAQTSWKKEDCRRFLLNTLSEAPGKTLSSERLNQKAQEAGFSSSTLNRVRSDLAKEGLVVQKRYGSQKRGTGLVCWSLQNSESEFPLLCDSTPTPFDSLPDIST